MTDTLPLILLPGMLCDARLWAHQVAALGGVTRIDIPVFHDQDSLEAMAECVLADAPERFALGGLSMGGYIAFEILRRAPERVVKLALVATSAHADTPEQTRVRRGLLQLAKKGRFKGVTPKLLPTLIHHGWLGEEALTDTIMDMAETLGHEAFIHQETAVMHRRDTRDVAARYTGKTLIICGKQDQRTPPELSEEMHALLPNSELHLLDECGHLPPMEQAEQTTELMRGWLFDD